jgi:hypothetical protein
MICDTGENHKAGGLFEFVVCDQWRNRSVWGVGGREGGLDHRSKAKVALECKDPAVTLGENVGRLYRFERCEASLSRLRRFDPIDSVPAPDGTLAFEPFVQMLLHCAVQRDEAARFAQNERLDRREVGIPRGSGSRRLQRAERGIDAGVTFGRHRRDKVEVHLGGQDDIDGDVVTDGRVELEQAPCPGQVFGLSPRLEHWQDPANRLDSGTKLGRESIWCLGLGHPMLQSATQLSVRPRDGCTQQVDESQT